jgi:hypothetical protein
VIALHQDVHLCEVSLCFRMIPLVARFQVVKRILLAAIKHALGFVQPVLLASLAAWYKVC